MATESHITDAAGRESPSTLALRVQDQLEGLKKQLRTLALACGHDRIDQDIQDCLGWSILMIEQELAEACATLELVRPAVSDAPAAPRPKVTAG